MLWFCLAAAGLSVWELRNLKKQRQIKEMVFYSAIMAAAVLLGLLYFLDPLGTWQTSLFAGMEG